MADDNRDADALMRLRQVGLRPTRQRLALCRLLFAGGDRHVSAERLHSEALAAGHQVSVATVYNTLHQLTEAGVLREVVVDSTRTYFDTNTGPHQHFFIEDTGALIDIPVSAAALRHLPPPPRGHRVDQVDIVIRLRSDA